MCICIHASAYRHMQSDYEVESWNMTVLQPQSLEEKEQHELSQAMFHFLSFLESTARLYYTILYRTIPYYTIQYSGYVYSGFGILEICPLYSSAGPCLGFRFLSAAPLSKVPTQPTQRGYPTAKKDPEVGYIILVAVKELQLACVTII